MGCDIECPEWSHCSSGPVELFLITTLKARMILNGRNIEISQLFKINCDKLTKLCT